MTDNTRLEEEEILKLRLGNGSIVSVRITGDYSVDTLNQAIDILGMIRSKLYGYEAKNEREAKTPPATAQEDGAEIKQPATRS